MLKIFLPENEKAAKSEFTLPAVFPFFIAHLIIILINPNETALHIP
jgi:hypothetical protein